MSLKKCLFSIPFSYDITPPMKRFLLISDVYCPWCYAFDAQLRPFLSSHPDWPIQVWCGNLIYDPVTLADMLEQYPDMERFYKLLTKKTGAVIGSAHLKALTDQSQNFPMHSIMADYAFVAIRELLPDRALDVLEAFHKTLYVEGKNLLDETVQIDIAQSLGVSKEAFLRSLANPEVEEKVYEESETAEELMGEFLLYPTLYAQTSEDEFHFIARGYVLTDTVEKAFQELHL